MRLFNDQLNVSESVLPAATLAGFYASHAASLFQAYGIKTHAYSFLDTQKNIVYGNFESSNEVTIGMEGLSFLRGETGIYNSAVFVSLGGMLEPQKYGFSTAFFATFGTTGTNFTSTTSQVALPCFITEKEVYVGFKAAHLLSSSEELSHEEGNKIIMKDFYKGVEAYMEVKKHWLNKDNPYNLCY